MPRWTPILVAASASLALSACAGSSRLDLPGFGGPRTAAAPQAPASRGPAEPLPPPSYPGGAEPLPPTVPGQPVISGSTGSSVEVSPLPPTIPGGSAPPASAIPPPAAASAPTIPPTPAPPTQIAAPSSAAAVGGWTARDATGATCRVNLSSAPALDLNRASTAGCANRDLQRVNAWKQQGGEIYLYSAGSVVARLPAGGSNMSGVLSRSGAPLTLTR